MPHAPLRRQLAKLVAKGLTAAGKHEAVQLAHSHAPFLVPLLNAEENYKALLREASQNSPASALLHPSERVNKMAQDLEAMNFKGVAEYPDLLRVLAEECPLFF